MIITLCTFLAVSAASTLGQSYEDLVLVSPCPDVFTYEPPDPNIDRWYGVVNVTTDNVGQLRLDILLDDKADILGSWIGEVTTLNNKDYTIVIEGYNKSSSTLEVRFFVKYKHLKRVPRLETIRLDGREICSSLRDPGTEVHLPPVTIPPESDYDEGDFHYIDLAFGISENKYPEDTQDPPKSPCPDVFTYEPFEPETSRWYGLINMTTKCNHSMHLNIVLDDKAEILANWIGEVSTLDNKNYTITADLQNSSIAVSELRFFVNYNPLKKMPQLVAIRLNGNDICSRKSDPGTNSSNRTSGPTNGSTQKGPDVEKRFIDNSQGMFQKENSIGLQAQIPVAPNPIDQVTKHSETTTVSNQSTTTPKQESERKKVETEQPMSKPAIDIKPTASTAAKGVSTEAAAVSTTTARPTETTVAKGVSTEAAAVSIITARSTSSTAAKEVSTETAAVSTTTARPTASTAAKEVSTEVSAVSTTTARPTQTTAAKEVSTVAAAVSTTTVRYNIISQKTPCSPAVSGRFLAI
ncbi:hypothetical protein PYW07_008437 [Mythimna separata]|uniref:Serine protease gd N-terminal domain-containing protein n=1 Tax=Mythimna separata TaxID=271217 RepID=A0AAD8DMV5_MYTSE|nr:hypothetical protein PYW07_008437 [Mythimna separata]